MTQYHNFTESNIEYYYEILEDIDEKIAGIEGCEKEEGIERVRNPKYIDLMFQSMANEWAKLCELMPLDEIEKTDKRYQAILRIERCQKLLALKVGLLRQRAVVEAMRKKEAKRLREEQRKSKATTKED